MNFAKGYGALNFGPEVALFAETRPPSGQSGIGAGSLQAEDLPARKGSTGQDIFNPDILTIQLSNLNWSISTGSPLPARTSMTVTT